MSYSAVFQMTDERNTSVMLTGQRSAAIRLGNGLWMYIYSYVCVGQTLHLFMGLS